MSKRFKIVDGSDYCYLVDSSKKLNSIPLYFKYSDLSEENKKELQKWLDFLNKKGGKK